MPRLAVAGGGLGAVGSGGAGCWPRTRGGSGGLVAVDRHGNVALPFNSPGMYRAWCDKSGEIRTAIFRADVHGSDTLLE